MKRGSERNSTLSMEFQPFWGMERHEGHKLQRGWEINGEI